MERLREYELSIVSQVLQLDFVKGKRKPANFTETPTKIKGSDNICKQMWSQLSYYGSRNVLATPIKPLKGPNFDKNTERNTHPCMRSFHFDDQTKTFKLTDYITHVFFNKTPATRPTS